MTFKLPDLPYSFNALEPFMDAKTVEIHHDKHHAGYTAKLNTALEKFPEFYDIDIVEILSDLNKIPEEVRSAVRNNGGGYFHHNLWWEQLTPNGGGSPTGKILDALNKKFGNFESFKKQISDKTVAVFGSGWGWLCKNQAGELVITTTANQDSPVTNGLHPVLTIDVWEHAYYLKYQNRRPEFVENFWNMVNWEVVNSRL